LLNCGLCGGSSILTEVRLPTGEPCAGDPHARFGGGRDRVTTRPSYPHQSSTWHVERRRYFGTIGLEAIGPDR
ncbi:MAG: hypothetical protein ABIH23_29425, partial [bacterium]